jgi:integrase
MAIKVKLRQKAISGNRQSLYLDFYPAIPHPETGEPTRREFLGMYIPDPVNFKKRKDKNGNEKQIPVYESNPGQNSLVETDVENILKRAELIRQKREKQLNEIEVISSLEKRLIEKDKKEQEIERKEKERTERNFVAYFKSLTDKRKASNHDNWVSAYNYLETFTKGNLKFADLNENFCNEFKEYLLTTKSNKSDKVTLAQNSAVSYFNKLKATLKQAYKDGYLLTNLNAKIECIETQETIKQTLTIEELNMLAKAECKYPLLKKYVLFSALTGMPFMEMQNLIWGQVEISETFGIRIKMIRQKTRKPYLINISEQAYNLMGERKEPTDKVFEGLNNNDRYVFFPLWLADAGIKKEMTFHDLRHTYGCLQIDSGTDIYTLQGNMGHSTPRQSMHYGKISDQRKREAAEKIQVEL